MGFRLRASGFDFFGVLGMLRASGAAFWGVLGKLRASGSEFFGVLGLAASKIRRRVCKDSTDEMTVSCTHGKKECARLKGFKKTGHPAAMFRSGVCVV